MVSFRVSTAVLAAAAASILLAVPAQAAPQTVQESPYATIALFDPGPMGALFVNTTRAALCTPERLAWEQADFDWWQIPDNPAPEPPQPASTGAVSGTATYDEVRPGVVVYSFSASNLPAELWGFNASVLSGGPLIGPCVDTEGGSGLLGTGTGTWKSGDNDRFGYEADGRRTRGNAFFDLITATVTGDAGTLKWTGNFHNRITPDFAYRFAGGEQIVTHR